MSFYVPAARALHRAQTDYCCPTLRIAPGSFNPRTWIWSPQGKDFGGERARWTFGLSFAQCYQKIRLLGADAHKDFNRQCCGSRHYPERPGHGTSERPGLSESLFPLAFSPSAQGMDLHGSFHELSVAFLIGSSDIPTSWGLDLMP